MSFANYKNPEKGCAQGGKKNTQRLKILDGKNPVDKGEAKPRHEKTRERPKKKLLKNRRRNHITEGLKDEKQT